MFQHGGVCYVAMPKHVAGPFPRVSLTTSAPVVNGTGTVILPFWEGVDLALAIARGGLEPRCEGKLESLDLTARQATVRTAQLLRLTPSGEEIRDDLRIDNRSYLTFDGILTTRADIGQGTSGAFAFAEGVPIGMAITSDDNSRATFMRAEEIHMNLGRYLGEQGAAFGVREPQPAFNATAQPGTIPLRLVRTSVPPVNPRYAPENMTGDGLFVFQPQRRMEFVFRVAGEDIAAISRLRIMSPEGPDYSLPKTLLIQTSIKPDESGYRLWKRGQMPPDGLFDTGERAPRNTRWIKITILATWADGPVAIKAVTAQ